MYEVRVAGPDDVYTHDDELTALRQAEAARRESEVRLRGIIDAAPDLTVVGEAADGAEALAVVRATQPDVVLMDVRMPTMDGVEATREVVAAAPETKVIVLTTFDLDEYVHAALRAGASGFLLKDAGPDLLVQAVHAAARGDALIAPNVTRRLLVTLAVLARLLLLIGPAVLLPAVLQWNAAANAALLARDATRALEVLGPDQCSQPLRCLHIRHKNRRKIDSNAVCQPFSICTFCHNFGSFSSSCFASHG